MMLKPSERKPIQISDFTELHTAGRWGMRIIFSAFAAVAVAGCQTIPREPGPPPPANYRALIAADMRAKFYDPWSVRDVSITEPYVDPRFPGWLVCIRANSKNQLGGYTGQQPVAYLLRDGKVIENNVSRADEVCSADKPMTPWNIRFDDRSPAPR